MFTFTALSNFFTYFFVGITMLFIFTALYIKTTPYNELTDIREGKVTSAITLVGAMLGFLFPILSLSIHGATIVEFISWSVVAGLVQLTVFAVMYKAFTAEAGSTNVAYAVFYAGVAMATGLMNAFSLIPY
jgi:putative membrane protein